MHPWSRWTLLGRWVVGDLRFPAPAFEIQKHESICHLADCLLTVMSRSCYLGLNSWLLKFSLIKFEMSMFGRYVELDTIEFTLGELLNVVISQGMMHSEAKGLEIFHETPEKMMNSHLYGDQLRLQQILSNFLWNVIQFTPEGERITLKLNSTKKDLGGGLYVLDLEFRIAHPGSGLPDELLDQMHSISNTMSPDGYGLFLCRKLAKLMNGDVQYLRGGGTSCFVIVVELAADQNN